jgi:hypothetical protein
MGSPITPDLGLMLLQLSNCGAAVLAQLHQMSYHRSKQAHYGILMANGKTGCRSELPASAFKHNA